MIKAGKPVAYDFEDWYSRDYLVPERPIKLLQSLEEFAVENGAFITAASRSMADEIKKQFSSTRSIETIYNGFSNSEDTFHQKRGQGIAFKIIWFSRTVGPDRGLEPLIAALKHSKAPCELHLLGMLVEGYDDIISKKFPFENGHSLHFHEFVPHNKLLGFLSSFDMGLALDLKINDNRNLTITNKIIQYIQANLPVLCSNTIGHLEVASNFLNSIHIVDIYNEYEVAQKINFLYGNLKSYSKEDKQRFINIFSWEAQETKLTNLINKHLFHTTHHDARDSCRSFLRHATFEFLKVQD